MDAYPIVPRGALIRASVRLPDHVVSAEISRELLSRLTRPAVKP